MIKMYFIYNVKKALTNILLILIVLVSNCSFNEREYKNRINGIPYGRIHRMGSILIVAVNNIDTISQKTLINFAHCLEDEESKRGSETRLLDIYDEYLYIDQLTPKNLHARIRFKPDTTLNHDKRVIELEYLIPKSIIEIEYKPIELKCNIE